METLLELIEADTARLQVGTYKHSLRPHWSQEWPLGPADFYTQARTRLLAIQSPEEFDWSVLEPVYPFRGFALDVTYLVAWLLENGKAEAWCVGCQRSYQVSDIVVYDWQMAGELKGAEYVCPESHVLLTTTYHIMGALSNAPLERKQRSQKPCV